jgi:hypothetical protein
MYNSKVITTFVTAVTLALGLSACNTDDLGIHPETRSVVKKGVNPDGTNYIVCRSSWTNSSGAHHSDQKNEVSASKYAKTEIGDKC